MGLNSKKKYRGLGIYFLPNLFTISALFAGFYAIIAALKGVYGNAAVAIFIAMIMDSLDGRIARITNTVSTFGAELDSLSDMVAFGIAPALVVYSWSLNNIGKFGWLAAFIFAAAVALRLARFNSQVNKDRHFFQGLPCPAAAALLASIVWIGHEWELPEKKIAIFIALITVLLSFLMISNVRYRSFKDFNLKRHVPFVVIIVTVLTLVFISINPPEVLCALFSIYTVSGPVMTIWQLREKKKKRIHHHQH